MASEDKCPVDHAALASSSQQTCPVDHTGAHAATSDEKCPVDHTARSSWTSWFSSNSTDAPLDPHSATPTNTRLPQERETSSIPRMDGSKWVYPSQAQFYAAMERKNHNPHAPDMQVIVPIHNAVNERAWAELMKWEAGEGGDRCGGVKLVSFKGRPKDRTPKARWKMLLGYSAPFDRHDWVVDRCGTRLRYVIDFYTGHSQTPSANNLSFYLDVRPAMDNWEGVRLRATHFWHRWAGNLFSSSPSRPAPSSS
ncbi:cytochrome C1 heme lyase [Irpex rosettiformis]|uniref:Cytochrome C1 heme lyase n=1 Tax=Irpex rosettiformis TaxID=378272 RepID=A0ACB8UI59_9APHY|nr:cytochrome C1 heme lyase [Irpex rosettiformis]